MSYKIISINYYDPVQIAEITLQMGYLVVFDARSALDKTRITVSPYETSGIMMEYGLIYVDQLSLGQEMSPESSFINDEKMEDWWMTLIRAWVNKRGVVFLTGATNKKIERGNTLAQQIIKRLKVS
jgi:hypothetical protein